MQNIQNLKKAALALGLTACLGLGFADKAHAEEAMPSSGVEIEALNQEISNLELSYENNENVWDTTINLTLLYYDRGNYESCYKMSKKALKMYEKGQAYLDDDDMLREALVKGAAAAYNMGEYRDSEKLLNKLIKLNLQGSEENQKTYMGWAYYYLSNIERIRGNHDRAHFYGGIAIDLCPHHDVFLDYWGGFIRVGVYWRWRHHHAYYRPHMLPPRHHWRDHGHRPVVHHPRPTPHHVKPMHGPVHERPKMERPAQQRPAVQRPAQPRPKMERPAQQKPAVQRPAQPRPKMERPAQQRPAVQRPAKPRPQMQRPTQQRPQMQRPTQQRPAYQPRPQMQRPTQQRPAYQPRPQMQRPAQQRPAYQPRPQMQRPAQQRPAYQPRPQMQRPAQQRPAYQPRPQMQRPVQQRPQMQRPAPQRAPQRQDQQYPYGQRQRRR